MAGQPARSLVVRAIAAVTLAAGMVACQGSKPSPEIATATSTNSLATTNSTTVAKPLPACRNDQLRGSASDFSDICQLTSAQHSLLKLLGDTDTSTATMVIFGHAADDALRHTIRDAQALARMLDVVPKVVAVVETTLEPSSAASRRLRATKAEIRVAPELYQELVSPPAHVCVAVLHGPIAPIFHTCSQTDLREFWRHAGGKSRS